MITLEVILELHDLSISKYGGLEGIRDSGLLESAIMRPYQTFANEDLYPTAIEKAAAIAESIIINHPFIDGNKRTGFLAMFAILNESKLNFKAANEDIYLLILRISTGEIKFEVIVKWLIENTISSS
ncbi:MAG: type II toxin-antitoxin system death-on-curing family toxin [Bacteroidetes bacterium]|nr:type II toxin-antitoxin system death-on-curing family toxin [Bacteroidota bacterium]